MLFGTIYFFRWSGIKGIVSFSVGVLFTIILFLSKNSALMMFVKIFSGEWYVDEIKKNEKSKKRN